MSGPVDVLAVLDSVLEGQQTHSEIIEARGAVAELIEADKEYDAAMERFDAAERTAGTLDYGPALGALGHAQNRRAAALARVGGAS